MNRRISGRHRGRAGGVAVSLGPGPATIRQLVERVYKQSGASVYATVQKLLDRLESKGFVERDRGGRFMSSARRSTVTI